jgi:type I restriction-modification system DNA methylase subunit
LTDIPNPDGWDLNVEDMFLEGRLAGQARKNTILLANPPFENFTPEERSYYEEAMSPVRFVNKAAEMAWRCLPHLTDKSVFGLILPQTLLHSANSTELRRFLANECEIKEICLFPDKEFSFSDAASAMIIGRKHAPSPMSNADFRGPLIRDIVVTPFL